MVIVQWHGQTLRSRHSATQRGALAAAAALAHPFPNAELAVVVDASGVAVGAALNQKIHGLWQPLAFFSKKLNAPQERYSAYDRELLAAYLSVKHFRHMLEGRNFVIFTDHKPLIFAFSQKPEKCTPNAVSAFELFSTVHNRYQAHTGQRQLCSRRFVLKNNRNFGNFGLPGTSPRSRRKPGIKGHKK